MGKLTNIFRKKGEEEVVEETKFIHQGIPLDDQLLLIFAGRQSSPLVSLEALALAGTIKSLAKTIRLVPLYPQVLDSYPSEVMEFIYLLWSQELNNNNDLLVL